MLFCTKCRTSKEVSEFSPRPSKRGYHSWCRQCVASNMKDRRGAGKSPYDPEARRNYDLQRNYGISAADYDLMLEGQGGCCAICSTRQCRSGRRLAVDHDHETGAVRGLLCESCNRGIGKFYHNPDLLRGAAQYLERTQSCVR